MSSHISLIATYLAAGIFHPIPLRLTFHRFHPVHPFHPSNPSHLSLTSLENLHKQHARIILSYYVYTPVTSQKNRVAVLNKRYVALMRLAIFLL